MKYSAAELPMRRYRSRSAIGLNQLYVYTQGGKEEAMTVMNEQQLRSLVRRKYDILLGGQGVEATFLAVKSVIDLFALEIKAGHSRKISVEISADESVVITNYNRGASLDAQIISGHPKWYYTFSSVDTSVPLEDSFSDAYRALYGSDTNSVNSSGIGLYSMIILQCCSSLLSVVSVQNGIKKRLTFRNGIAETEPETDRESGVSYTRFTILPDQEVFGNISIPYENFASLLRDISKSFPGVLCEISDRRNGNAESFCEAPPDSPKSTTESKQFRCGTNDEKSRKL